MSAGAESVAGLTRWLHELSRRRVTHAALAYAAFAWLTLQVGSLILQTLALPAWTMRLLLALVLLGFPLVVLLSWFFDLTPGGTLRRDSGETADGAAVAPLWHPAVAGVAVLAAAIVTAAIAMLAWPDRQPSAVASSSASIAVLPFASLSDAPEDRYFAEGLGDELLVALTRVEGLRVAARTSAYAARARDLDVKAIGATLGVASVLQATVRRAGDQVRITARLEDSVTGYTRWSQTYDRKLGDTFAIQRDIARQVAQATLGEIPTDELVDGTEPADATAYERFLRAKRLMADPVDDPNLTGPIELLAASVAADSGFAPSQASLCRAYVARYLFTRDAKALEPADTACSAALALSPKLGDVLVAQATLDLARGEHARAIDRFNRSLEDPASRAAAYIGLGRAFSEQGHSDEAREFYERAQALEPANPFLWSTIGYTQMLDDKYAAAADTYRTAIALAPDDSSRVDWWTNLGTCYMLLARFDDGIDAYEHALSIRQNSGTLSNLGLLHYYKGEYSVAADKFRRAATLAPDDYRVRGNIGTALAADPGTRELAHEQFAKARELVREYLATNTNAADARSDLAWYEANLGATAAARRNLDALKLDTNSRADIALTAAMASARLGDEPRARALAAHAVALGYSPRIVYAEPLLRTFDPAAGGPRP